MYVFTTLVILIQCLTIHSYSSRCYNGKIKHTDVNKNIFLAAKNLANRENKIKPLGFLPPRCSFCRKGRAARRVRVVYCYGFSWPAFSKCFGRAPVLSGLRVLTGPLCQGPWVNTPPRRRWKRYRRLSFPWSLPAFPSAQSSRRLPKLMWPCCSAAKSSNAGCV